MTGLSVDQHGSVFSIRRVTRGGFRTRRLVRELRSLARTVVGLPASFMAAWAAEWDELARIDHRRACPHAALARESRVLGSRRLIYCGACGESLYSDGVWHVAVRDPHACTCPAVEVEGGGGFLLHSRESIGHDASCPLVWWEGAPPRGRET